MSTPEPVGSVSSAPGWRVGAHFADRDGDVWEVDAGGKTLSLIRAEPDVLNVRNQPIGNVVAVHGPLIDAAACYPWVERESDSAVVCPYCGEEAPCGDLDCFMAYEEERGLPR